jgi:hypothetical protein
MFTVKDLTSGDLVATFHMTITQIQALPAKVNGQTLFSVQGTDWNDNHNVDIIVPANKEIEVWE